MGVELILRVVVAVIIKSHTKTRSASTELIPLLGIYPCRSAANLLNLSDLPEEHQVLARSVRRAALEHQRLFGFQVRCVGF